MTHKTQTHTHTHTSLSNTLTKLKKKPHLAGELIIEAFIVNS